MEEFKPNPAIHLKASTERDRNAYQKLKRRHINLIMGCNDAFVRQAAYTGLQAICFSLDEDCPPLAWFPCPAKRQKKGVV